MSTVDVIMKPIDKSFDVIANLPPAAKFPAFLFLLCAIIFSLFLSLNTYFIFSGRAQHAKIDEQNSYIDGEIILKEINPTRIHDSVSVSIKKTDIGFQTTNEGNFTLPISVMRWYFDLGAPDSLPILVEKEGEELLIAGTINFYGFFGRSAQVLALPFDGGVDYESDPTLTRKQAAQDRGETPARRRAALDWRSPRLRLISTAQAQPAVETPTRNRLKIESINLLGPVSADRRMSIDVRRSDGDTALRSFGATGKNEAIMINRPVTEWSAFRKYIDHSGAESSDVTYDIYNTLSGERLDSLTVDYSELQNSTYSAQGFYNVESNLGKFSFDITAKTDYELVVFKRSDIEQDRSGIIAATDEAGVWYRAVSSRFAPSTATNALFIGEDVPFSVARDIVQRLSEEAPSIRLKRIAYEVALISGRNDTMQLGHSTDAEARCTEITPDQRTAILGAVAYADWSRILEPCQRGE